jgi:hypothetical protein
MDPEDRLRMRYSLFSGVLDVQNRLPELVGKFQSRYRRRLGALYISWMPLPIHETLTHLEGAYWPETNETGSVKVPFAVGLNFQLAFTQRAVALANMGGPEPSASTIFPASTVILTRTSPEMCDWSAWAG